MEFNRVCKICGEDKLLEGYCVSDGLEYYCSTECLEHDYTEEEWEEAYNDGWCYWTEWDEDDYNEE